MIRLDEVNSIECDYEKLEISLLDKYDKSLHTIECFTTFEHLEKFQELTHYFIKSINGSKINIKITTPQKKLITTLTKYKGGSLFMHFSSSERIE